MHTGRCLCGLVRYELDGRVGPVTHCHCHFCRRAHGAPFTAVSYVMTEKLRFVAGEDAIREFHTQGVGYRAFCGECGSRLYNRGESTDRFRMLTVDTLDDDSDVRPIMHVNVESKASWYQILDDLPQHQAFPDYDSDA